VFYGWVILGVCFVNVCAEGAIKNLFPVLLLPLIDAFGWSHAATAAIFSMAGLVNGLGSPVMGVLLDRIGARKYFPLGGLLLCVGLALASRIDSYWQLVVVYACFVAIGENMVSSYGNVAVIGRWFRKRRGAAIGIADTGTALGAAIFVPLAQWLILHLGWRHTFAIFAGIFLVMLVPTNLIFMRSGPEDKGQVVDGEPGTTEAHGESLSAHRTSEMTLRQAARTPSLYLLTFARLFGTAASYMITIHIIAFFVDAGYRTMVGASALAFSQAVSFFGRPLSGMISDRIGREAVLTISYALAIGSIAVILAFGNGTALWPIALYVLLNGLSSGPVGIAVGAKAADLYPGPILGSVMGIINMGRGAGLALGPVLGGLLYDLTRSYRLAFSVAIAFVLLSFACFWMAHLMRHRRYAVVDGKPGETAAPGAE
jgi:MFS family permease